MSNTIGWFVAFAFGTLLLMTLAVKSQPMPTIVDAKSPSDEVLPGMYVFGGGKFVVKWIGFGDTSEIVVGMKGSVEPPIQIVATDGRLKVTNANKVGTPIGLAP